MDEYFCTKCGATLNWQYGFDPDKPVWTCTECGQLLTDGTGYEGERFKDVAWFCDSCGAYLNRQVGFSDLDETWICTECGYVNSISEDNIFGSSTVSQIRENNETMDEGEETFFCPNCGVRLNDQDSFDRYEDDYECAECGASLHHDYPSEEYIQIRENTETMDGDEETFFCPNCGARLNDQDLFDHYEDNYECIECGASLHHDYSSEEYSIEESIPLRSSAYSARTCNSEVQKVKDPSNAQVAIKKRPVYNVFAYICGVLSIMAFYKVLVHEAPSSAFSGVWLAILSLMLFALSTTPKFDKCVRVSRFRIRKSFFVFLCIVGMCKLPSITVTFFEWLFSFWN